MSDFTADISQLRREYLAQGVSRGDLSLDPVTQFSKWFDVACHARPDDATSMTLATADKQGRPSARIVLLKHFDSEGFCWYTDQESQKGKELAENPQAEILFYWYGLERQIRIKGRVETLNAEQADTYFHARPLGSQLSALASHQSQPVESRELLERRVAELETLYSDNEVPRPARWGGYRLIPDVFEFWQGRESRLHDRFRYDREADQWHITRLQP
jgi:pyridoxamine 5'-phosphate oxidase